MKCSVSCCEEVALWWKIFQVLLYVIDIPQWRLSVILVESILHTVYLVLPVSRHVQSMVPPQFTQSTPHLKGVGNWGHA